MENIYIMKLMEATKHKMETLISGKDFKDLKVDFKITFGNPFHQIEDEMANNPADLIIMGSRGSTGAAEVLLGSNAEKVVRNSQVPVMVLHSKIKLNDIKDIVFASSFLESDDNLAKHLLTLQDFFDANLHLLKVNTPAYFAPTRYDRRKMEEFVKDNSLKHTTINIYNDEQEEIGIRHFAEDIDADLIAMATHGRKGLGHFLLGSVTEDVANRTSKPIWTYKMSN
ncbi:MAG: universal stress protein [Bacteroidetes bacterium]|nr:universal stress protein [Bacteroidota bacterium]MDA1122561.1 universal stress protein [Bacteroidota bacterium]